MLELAVLAAVAFFVASGAGTLIAGAAARELAAPEVVAETGSSDARADRKRADDTGSARLAGAAILARNIFDSTVGPIGAEGGDGSDDRRASADAPGSLAPCGTRGLGVLATVAAEHESYRSFALIERSGEKVYRGVGEELDGRTVETIGWRYVVLAQDDGRRCYLDLHGGSVSGVRPTRSDRDSQ